MSAIDAARAIPALQVAQHERLYPRQRGRKWWACCPLHKEKTPSLAFYEDGGWYCYGCGAGGDGIAFYAALHGIGQGEAARALVREFGLDGAMSPSKPRPIRDAGRWRNKEIEELNRRIYEANLMLDWITAHTATWDDAWNTPGFTDAIRARELFERGLDTLIFSAYRRRHKQR